jgi:hypothetical protein
MKHLHCSIFGHDYRVTKEVTFYVKEYKCKHCRQEVTVSAEGTIVPLTPKQKSINRVLHKVHLKRLEKSQRWLMIQD